METLEIAEFTDEDLEIVELPQREAMSNGRGGGGGNRGSVHHNTVTNTTFFGIFIDLW